MDSSVEQMLRTYFLDKERSFQSEISELKKTISKLTSELALVDNVKNTYADKYSNILVFVLKLDIDTITQHMGNAERLLVHSKLNHPTVTDIEKRLVFLQTISTMPAPETVFQMTSAVARDLHDFRGNRLGVNHKLLYKLMSRSEVLLN
jgi:hypothetical protein